MRKIKHIGAYGLVLKGAQILLIKKKSGPYAGKLDLPGGTIEFGERPKDTLVREVQEETGLEVINCSLFDADSVLLKWSHKGNLENIQHIGFFYMINKYKNSVKKEILITEQNDDSMGADFYEIKSLKKDQVSDITLLELKKLGFKITK